MDQISEIRLTQYSHGAGCGCKISPEVLDEILREHSPRFEARGLLVGNDTRDDAAVYDLGDGTAVISTTDFFMPIVDDPYDFGRVAAVNAISDVYAMGGTPLVAIAILGWPVDKLPAEVASRVVEGGRAACAEAGIPLAGGHSIDSPEPIFGLAVTGRVEMAHLKRNNGARPGDLLFLTKPLGVGILSTAQKQGKLRPEHQRIALESMVRLNRIGEELGRLEAITAMTDVTGFGLLGHLVEMCQGSGHSAQLDKAAIPVLDPVVNDYLRAGCIPGGTHRNWASYGEHIAPMAEEDRWLLCDPQTSGGLLCAINPTGQPAFHEVCECQGLQLALIGQVMERGEQLVVVS